MIDSSCMTRAIPARVLEMIPARTGKSQMLIPAILALLSVTCAADALAMGDTVTIGMIAENSAHSIDMASYFTISPSTYALSPEHSFLTVTGDTLYFAPGFDDAQSYTVTITAAGKGPDDTINTPDDLSESKIIEFTITDVNRPPVICGNLAFVLNPGIINSLDISQCIRDPDTGDSIESVNIVFEQQGTVQQLFEDSFELLYPSIRVMVPDGVSFDPVRAMITVTDSNDASSVGGIDISIRPAGSVMLEQSNDISKISDTHSSTSIRTATVQFNTESNVVHGIQFHDDAASLAAAAAGGEPVSHVRGKPIQFLAGAVDIELDYQPVSEIESFSIQTSLSTLPICPCNLTLSYVDQPGIDEDRLAIFHFDSSQQEWEQLDTASHDMEANTITTIISSTDGFSPFAIGVIDSESADYTEWRKKPTFGTSWETDSVQLVESGFTFNDYALDITDNWHTDFEKTSSIIGETNHVEIKVYAPQGLDSISLVLGIPEIGDTANAESVLDIMLQTDYSIDAGHVVSEIIHKQSEPLVDPDLTDAYITKSYCNESHTEMYCYTILLEFTINAPLSYDILAIQAVDSQYRLTTTYLNHGIEFVGDSLIEPDTATVYSKTSNQADTTVFELVQVDRRFPIYEDQFGDLWHINSFDTWSQITPHHVPRPADPPGSVMTRHDSYFEEIIRDEHDRALGIFDSDAIQGHLDDPRTLEFGGAERMDSELLARMNLAEQQALEILEAARHP